MGTPHASDTAVAKVAVAAASGAHSYAEIIELTGLAKSTIHAALVELRDEGVVTWDPTKSHTLRCQYARVDL